MGLLLPRGSTPSGSVAPSWLLSPPSSPCGSRRRSMTSPVPPSSTESASRVQSTNKCHPLGFRERKKQFSMTKRIQLCKINTSQCFTKKKKKPPKKKPPPIFKKKKKKKKKKK